MWIPSRGVNGEYGYLNTETGEFRTTLPNSKEEKLKEQLKLRKAALVTHSARLAKFDRTDAKRRNHSDETIKKKVNVPVMSMNPDGTFTNNYVLLIAPSENSLSTHDPIAEFYIGAKALNPVFNMLGKGYTYGMARLGDNYNRSKIISNMLNLQISKYNGTVSKEYFHSPYNWYRITESPEVYGIKELGRNVTTRDAVNMFIPSNNFRLSIIENNLTNRNGYWYKPLKRKINFSKIGSAHGNTSLASKGHLWQGTTADSLRFPKVILEGDMPVLTYRGFNPATGLDSRTSFHLVDSETIPIGDRIGFHTGEMPIEGLRSFTKLNNGRYIYNGPVIPYRISNYTLSNTLYRPTYFMEGTTANGFPVVGRITRLYDNTSAIGGIFKSLHSDVGSERAVYNGLNPNYVIKVEDAPYTFELLASMKPRNNPFVPEPTIGVVQQPKGTFYRVTKLERVPIIPKRYTKLLELKIADYLNSEGWQVYRDAESGRLEVATKDGILLNDIGPGNIGFTNSGEVKIIDPNFLNIKDMPDWHEGLLPW